MLVFISDLHFVDGTAGEHNVPPAAFEGWLCDLAAMARKDGIKEIEVVYLGDIFDLIRTEAWLDAPVEERPWGKKTGPLHQKVGARAGKIMEDILNHEDNQVTFDLLSCDWKSLFNFPVEPTRTYIPGNHDRLCLLYPNLMDQARQALRVKDEKAFHTYSSAQYSTFARHGHEFDPLNNAGGDTFTAADYEKTPIGDPLTTELLVRLPYEVGRHPEFTSLDPNQQNVMMTTLKELDNVRPLSAARDWLFYYAQENDNLRTAVQESLHKAVSEFNDLAFVHEWYKGQSRWLLPSALALKIRGLVVLAKALKLSHLEALSVLAEKVEGESDDLLLQAAQKEYKRLPEDLRYVVYGHTHKPRQTPITRLTGDGGGAIEKVYINTGTCRASHHKAVQRGFITWKQFCFAVIYSQKEKPGSKGPTFETWTGALKEDLKVKKTAGQ